MSATTISMTAGLSFMRPTLVRPSGCVLDGSDTFGEQLGRRHSRQGTHLAHQVGLVDEPCALGDVGPRVPASASATARNSRSTRPRCCGP